MIKENIEWTKMGMLTIIKKTHKDEKRNWYVDCLCDCWQEFNTRLTRVKQWKCKSCWCYQLKVRTKHSNCINGRLSGAYTSWLSLKQRCTNKSNKDYKNRWGRWITVCDRWLEFNNFLEDMWERPEWKSIDRIDNEKWYYKENCRRATRKEQQNNRRRRLLQYKWSLYTTHWLAELLWITYVCLKTRISRYGIEKVLNS